LLFIRPVVERRVLIPSGAGSPGFGGIIECLRMETGMAIYAGDMQERAYGYKLADGYVKMPPSSDSTYLKAVISAARAFNCSTILPITTRELVPLSSGLDLLQAAGLNIAISPLKGLLVANNKAHLYDFMRDKNLPVVLYEKATKKGEFLHQIKKMAGDNKTVIIKPSEGNGSRGFRIVIPKAKMQELYFNSKAGSLYTTIASLEADLPEIFPSEMMVCEYLPGAEYSVDMLVNRGKTIIHTIREREKTVSGISVRGTFIDDEEISRICRLLASNLDLHGPIGMQFKRDEKGNAKILEINPRLQGAVSTAVFAGINFPLLAVKLANNEDILLPEYKKGVSFNRYWKDIQE